VYYIIYRYADIYIYRYTYIYIKYTCIYIKTHKQKSIKSIIYYSIIVALAG
jgi:hypothetical protein